jgi:hypothetical protein
MHIFYSLSQDNTGRYLCGIFQKLPAKAVSRLCIVHLWFEVPCSNECSHGSRFIFYCRFQVTFQRAVPKFVANLPITFPSSEIERELRNKVCKQMFILNNNNQFNEIQTFLVDHWTKNVPLNC